MRKMQDVCSLGDVLRDLLVAHWAKVIGIGAFIALVTPWTTKVGIVEASIVAYITLKTYTNNNSIRKGELIGKIFDIFMKDGRYEFYKKIQNGDQINLEDEKLLNEALTLFDELNYFRTQGLLDEKAWEYCACEIQNFALNNSVWEYIDKIQKPYREKGFIEDTIPFTGFRDLFTGPSDPFGKLPDKLKARGMKELDN